MSDNWVQKLANYCGEKGLSAPEYKLEDFAAVRMATVAVAGKETSQMGETDEVAKNKAARTMMESLEKGVILDQLVTSTRTLAGETRDNTSMHSSEHIDDDVAKIPNPVGYLNEFCQKNRYPQPEYEAKSQSGDPHCPLFVVECTVEAKGVKYVGKGKGCPKKAANQGAAQDVIRQLKRAAPQSTSNAGFDPMTVSLNSYFNQKFKRSAEVSNCLVQNGLDSTKALDKLVALIGCRLHYEIENSTQVVLKVIIADNNYPLVTTFADSTRGVDHNKNVAAKKALLMIKAGLTDN